MLALTYCFACFRGGQELPKSRSKSRQVGTMLAHFSLLGFFLSLWNASRTFVGRFFYSRSTFFSRFGWLRVGCLGIQGQFRGSETTFFGVLSSAQVCNAKKLRMCKNHSFSGVFVWFLHIASFVFKSQSNAKSFPGPVQQSFLQG